MNKITLAQLKEQQQISSLDEYTNLDLTHAEDIESFKDIFPKSVEAIEKLPPDKIYVNTADYQKTNDPDHGLCHKIREFAIDRILENLEVQTYEQNHISTAQRTTTNLVSR